MQRTILKNGLTLGVLCLLGGALTETREIRTPLIVGSNTFRGYQHYPLPWPTTKEMCADVNFWGAGLHRATDKAFINGTNTQSLSGLFFGQTTFTIANAFATGATITNPFFIFSQITPTFDYTEDTAFFGADVRWVFGCDCEYNVGIRGYIPFRAIKVALDDCCLLAETLENVMDLERELVDDEGTADPSCGQWTINRAFAYRLDFLAALSMEVNNPTNKLVNFANPKTMPSPNDITINNIDVTNIGPDANAVDQNPIYVFRSDTGAPPAPFTLRQSANTPCTPPVGSVNALPFLAADGSNLANGQAARFEAGVNYTPLGANVATQRLLWILPTGETTAGQVEVPPGHTNDQGQVDGVFDISAGGKNIRSIVDAILALPTDPDVISSLAALGVTFATQRRYQVGDLAAEIYVNRRWCNWFGELAFGARFPTGRTISATDVGNLLIAQTPAGNDGHFEVRGGIILGWDPTEWFAMKIDGYYNGALRKRENVAAAFTGATVKNIGPAVKADISWQYFVGDVDFTFMVPCICPELGFDAGYQFYWKSTDRVKFTQTTATDFSGNTSPLSAAVLKMNTNQWAHKVKAEFFQTVWGWQLFAGFAHTFAGKNAMRDTDWYIGFKAYF
jgi:hypothetical protein